MDRRFVNDWSWNQFPNIGYLKSNLTDEQLEPVRSEILEIQNNFSEATPYNHGLAGNLKHEYRLEKTYQYLNDLLLPMAYDYIECFGYRSLREVSATAVDEMVLDTVWANFQRKYEFNPTHTHYGVVSFVIWLQVPFNIEDELEHMENTPGHEKRPGNFSFTYNDALGKIRTENFPVDRSFENNILMFPSSMSHNVYPFYTSDDYRISISGNFKYNL